MTQLDAYTNISIKPPVPFYYNPLTHYMWLAHVENQEPYLLQEKTLAPLLLHFQLNACIVVPNHPLRIACVQHDQYNNNPY